MRLINLLLELGIESRGQDDFVVSGITADSRQVLKDGVFFAIQGAHDDGRKYIQDALSRGAKFIVSDDNCDNVRLALSKAAAMFFPMQPRIIAAVTGTDGKTSTVNFLRQIFAFSGLKSSSIGTLGVICDNQELAAKIKLTDSTTPDPVQLHKALQVLEQGGVHHVAIEASSHGLHQHRLDSVKLSAVGFTTFSQDHLDYHGSMEEYFNAKMHLFSKVAGTGAAACINMDDAMAAAVKSIAEKGALEVFTYGYAGADLRIISAEPNADGIAAVIDFFGNRKELQLNLVGKFQLYNALCAAGMAVGCGVSEAKVFKSLSLLLPVTGRLEKAGGKNGAMVYVDYAHTPNALNKALEALRPHTTAKLGVVFGCGGDRDKAKRPLMGKAAVDKADFVIVTDDNPRTENAGEIRRQVMTGAVSALEIGDRREAIGKAISVLQEGDVLLIAGKGHENYQIIGTEKYAFDDVKVAKEFLAV